MTLYDLLGVGPEATDKQIRAAYRRKAKAAHPDAGGDPAAIERLKFAHDLLLDEERRRRYDETGEEVPGRPDNALAEAVEAGISVFEDEFMAAIVLPDGQTVGEVMREQIAIAYRDGKMPPLLPDYRGGADGR